MDEHGPEGPNVGGALHFCLLCNQPCCLRHQPCCDEPCGKMCFLGCGVEAPGNCDRCVRKAARDLRTAQHPARALRLRIITTTNGITSREAEKMLKHSGLSVRLIRQAAGRGKAGTAAVKDAALVFASAMERDSQNGKDIRQRYVTLRRPTMSLVKDGIHPSMPAPDAIAAVDVVANRRGTEPMYADVPAETLAIAAEVFAEAADGVHDALVLADLSNALALVNGLIVDKVRKTRTHHHGWRASRIESLEAFARDEAKKAIRRVLARSRAAVEARRAKERPKKKRARARQRASEAKIKTAKAKGTYKNPRTGDTKNHFKYKTTVRDRGYRVKLAYNKVERYGPGTCTDLEVERHAEHKKSLERIAASYAARKGKKRL